MKAVRIMTLSKDAQTFLDHFDFWDPEGPTMRGIWTKISEAERAEIKQVLSERVQERNARQAEALLRGLPKKWRDIVISNVKDL